MTFVTPKLLSQLRIWGEGGRKGRSAEGREEGKEKGREEGREGGREEGREGRRERGREEGRKGGREGGREEGRKEEGRERGRERSAVMYWNSSFSLAMAIPVHCLEQVSTLLLACHMLQ